MRMPPKTAALALAAALGLAFSAAGFAAGESGIKALRINPVQGAEQDAIAFRQLPDQPPIPRDFVQQPPLIPHVTDGYAITANFNKCMDCHSWTRYKETNATKVSLTHFKDRDGRELSNISPRRYFCTQCHVPQTDAKPLVENTFQPATGVR